MKKMLSLISLAVVGLGLTGCNNNPASSAISSQTISSTVASSLEVSSSANREFNIDTAVSFFTDNRVFYSINYNYTIKDTANITRSYGHTRTSVFIGVVDEIKTEIENINGYDYYSSSLEDNADLTRYSYDIYKDPKNVVSNINQAGFTTEKVDNTIAPLSVYHKLSALKANKIDDDGADKTVTCTVTDKNLFFGDTITEDVKGKIDGDVTVKVTLDSNLRVYKYNLSYKFSEFNYNGSYQLDTIMPILRMPV